jgi:hypothetical protein
MIAAPERLTIGRLSALTGATVETIRYYERIRLLVPPPRGRMGSVSMGTPTSAR